MMIVGIVLTVVILMVVFIILMEQKDAKLHNLKERLKKEKEKK